MPKQERLSVWMYGRHVATLTRGRDRLGLAYTMEAQAFYDVNTPLLSVSLPVSPLAFPHGKTYSFFDALLPEGEARRILAYDLRVSVEDTFGLLRALGRDCAGALIILPEDEALPDPVNQSPIPLSTEELASRLRQLSVDPLGIDGKVRVSLAGVQQKMVLSRLPSGGWALPINGLPSTHILKRADTRFPDMVANEAYCLAVGRHLGLSVAEASILEMPDPILVVTRYDREVSPEGVIRRIHQEDLTQALGLNASAKYEEHGGPSLRAIARLLRDWTRSSESLERLLDITLLNMVVGNADAHAKNLSLLHQESGAVALAPAYDILSTACYPQVDVRPGMYINHKRSINDITASDVVAEARSWGLNHDRITTRITHLLDRIPSAIAAAAIDVPTVPPELVKLISARTQALRTTDRSSRVTDH